MFKKYQEIKSKFVRVGRSPDDLFRIYDEPTYLGFKLLFHFNDEMSPLLNINRTHSAYKYLLSINKPDKAEKLKKFIELLQKVSRESEWAFQSIEGLSDIWNYDFTKSKLRDNSTISINMLESLDLRITQIMSYYYDACFDENNRREIVPKNLRYFSMSVYVSDMRDFHSYYIDETKKDLSILDATIDMNNPYQRPSLFFRLELCEFDRLIKNEILNHVSNIDFTPATHKLSIIHSGNIYNYPNYVLNQELGDYESEEDAPQSLLTQTEKKTFFDKVSNKLNLDEKREILNKLKDGESRNTLINDTISDQSAKLKNKLTNFAERTALNIVNEGVDFVNSKVKSVILGNVYGKNASLRNINDVLNRGISVGDIT